MTQNIQNGINFLSPRNFIKMISQSIDQYKKTKSYQSFISDQQNFIQTFQPYLNSFSKEYELYQVKIKKKENIKKDQKNQEIQHQIKLAKIPKQYFDSQYQFKICKKSNIKQKQQELSEYLDQIQFVLFAKTSKYPFKSIEVMNNLDQTAIQINKSLKKVNQYRQKHSKKLLQISQKQLKVKRTQNKIKELQKKREYLKMMKRLKEIKEFAGNQLKNKTNVSLSIEIVQQIKKKELDICVKIISLKNIIANLQKYRMQIKQKIFQKFRKQIINIMTLVLKYDKSQWKTEKIKEQQLPQKIKNDCQILLDQSNMNITILDQSYFALQTNIPNHILTTQSQKKIIIQRKALQDSLLSVQEMWKSILKYDLYDQVQISELLMRELVKHNAYFSKDLNDYLERIYQKVQDSTNKVSLTKSKNKQTNDNFVEIQQNLNQKIQIEKLKKKKQDKTKETNNFTHKTLSSLKKYGKIPNFMYQQEEKHEIKVQFPQNNLSPENQKHQTKKKPSLVKAIQQQLLAKINIKIYMKSIMFYYQIILKLVVFIKNNQNLGFLKDFQHKFYNFIQGRVKYFMDIRKITGQTTIQDFLTYLSVIEFWDQHCQQIYECLKKLKQSIIDDYLTNLQKSILVTQLKQAIDQSKYTQTSIKSDKISTLNYVIGWKKVKQMKKYEELNMSVTMIFNDRQMVRNILQEHQQLVKLLDPNYLRIIDKILIVQGKSYKVCESFLILTNQIKKYLMLRDLISGFQQNVQEKLCEIIGFFVWYNQKVLNATPKPGSKTKTLNNLCVFYSTLSLLKHMFYNLQIKNKKFAKTISQFNQCQTQTQKHLTMTPFLLLQEQISSLYESKVMNKFQIPCIQSLKIIEIIQKSLQQFRQFFSLIKIKKFLQPSIKIIYKNYFGYMISLQKRGFLQLKQILPLLKNALLNYGYNYGYDKDQKTKINQETYLFLSELQSMQKTLKSKILLIK